MYASGSPNKTISSNSRTLAKASKSKSENSKAYILACVSQLNVYKAIAGISS